MRFQNCSHVVASSTRILSRRILFEATAVADLQNQEISSDLSASNSVATSVLYCDNGIASISAFFLPSPPPPFGWLTYR